MGFWGRLAMTRHAADDNTVSYSDYSGARITDKKANKKRTYKSWKYCSYSLAASLRGAFTGS